jgi:predicted ATP-grasp superfamily ATP-dependent carboligase
VVGDRTGTVAAATYRRRTGAVRPIGGDDASVDDVDALVLDLDSRAGLLIARALGRAGRRLAVASRNATASGLATRHAAARFTLPDGDRGVDAYADAIVAAARQCGARCVLTSSDVSLVALDARRDELAPCVPAIPSAAATAAVLDKTETLRIAEASGIPVPRGARAASLAELADAVAAVGLPAILKPTAGWQRDEHGGGLHAPPILLETPADVTAAMRLGWYGPVLVQEYATGVREAHMLFRSGGDVRARVAFQALRTWPPVGGSSVLRVSIEPPADSLAHAEALIAAIGIDGYCEVEFRRAADGRPLLMEINGRFSQALEVAQRAGVDMIAMQTARALGEPIPPAPVARTGVRVAWLAGDLRLAASAFGLGPGPRPPRGALLRALGADYSGRARLDGVDLRDPRPMVGAFTFAVREAIRWPARRGA